MLHLGGPDTFSIEGRLQLQRASLTEWLGFARNLAPGLQVALDEVTLGTLDFSVDGKGLRVPHIDVTAAGSRFLGSGGVASWAKPELLLDLKAETVNLGRAIPESVGTVPAEPRYGHGPLTPMSDISKPLISFAVLVLLFLAPIFFIHDYASDVTSNISATTLTRLAEVNARAGNNFYQAVRNSMMEMSGMTKYLAQQEYHVSREYVLGLAPLFYAHSVRRFSIVDAEGNGFDGGGTQTDYSNDPIFLRARQGLTHGREAFERTLGRGNPIQGQAFCIALKIQGDNSVFQQ